MLDPRVNRRLVLKGAAIAAASFGLGPRFLGRALAAGSSGKRILVAIFQRGAVDGLSMVVPYAEPRYAELRRSIAIAKPGASGGALDLDGTFGLHPEMASLHPYFGAGELAVVHACGSPDPTRSHFDAQDYMETGQPGDKSAADGWLNRHLQTTSGGAAGVGPMRAGALDATLPRALAGAAPALATTGLDQLTLGRGREAERARTAIEAMYGERSDLLGTSVRDALEAVDVAARLGSSAYTPANGAKYPTSELGGQLEDVARLIKGEVGLEIAFLNTGGWDTHTNQGGSEGTLARLLRDLSDSLVAFRKDLGERFAEVCVLTMSEFGRTAAESGGGGTDHGHATAMLAFGGTVAGGAVRGPWPGLAAAALAEGRDLAVKTDFRALFGEIVERHLGNPDVASVFPGFDYDPAARAGVIA